MDFTIRKTQESDFDQLKELHISVSKNPRGIARNPSEITDYYIQDLLAMNSSGGLGMVALQDYQIIGEIHAGVKGIYIFQHLLAYLTVAVHPNCQGKGVGTILFNAFLDEIKANRRDIYRVELESRASNTAGIRLYENMGFVKEGRMINQTRNLDGSHEDGVMMAWFNPAYERKSDL